MREKRSILRTLALAFLVTLALGTTSQAAVPYAKYVCPPPAFGANSLTQEGEYDGESDGMTYKDILELKDVYADYPALYREVWWDFIVDSREAAVYDGWSCSGLPTLVGTNQDDPAERCFISPSTEGGCTIPPDLSTLTLADRYIFNSLTPVLVKRPVSQEEYLVFIAQQNNKTGALRNSCNPCPWAEGTGPASWIQNTGDEFVIFSTSATLAGARGQDPLVLVDDYVREDDGWSWQFKAAIWESDRGTDGRMTAFAKRSLLGVIPGFSGREPMINEIKFQRTDDPRDLAPGQWETVLWECENPCITSDCTPEEQAACTEASGIRITDIALVDETTTYDWDYVGMLSWKTILTDPPIVAATPIRIKTRQRVELRMAVPGNPDGAWVDVGWGGKVDFSLWVGVPQTRVATIAKVTGQQGQDLYELWRIRTSARGGISPCDAVAGGDDSEYAPNLDTFKTSPNEEVTGRYADFIPWSADPDIADILRDGSGGPAGVHVFDSASGRDWHIPGDYPASYTWLLGRLEMEVDGVSYSFLYMGTRDTLICNHPSGSDYATGKAVAVGEMIRLGFPEDLIFSDGFEGGNLSNWSGVGE